MTESKVPNNIKELRDDLLEIYSQLKKDPRRLAQAAELSNTAGKIIASAKLEIEYAVMRGEKPECDFIGDGKSKLVEFAKEPAKLGEGAKK